MKRRLAATVTILAASSAITCTQPADPDGDLAVNAAALTSGAACTSHAIQVVDLQADFRDIWKGRETPDTGKQADPDAKVTVDFSTTVDRTLVAGQYIPAVTDASCGPTVAAAAGTAVVAAEVWGTATSDVSRPALPAPFNVLARETISGVVNAAGAIAAGGDVTLSSFSVNGTTHQPVGLIAGGAAVLTSGSVSGDLTFGVASTFPPTVTVTGKKSLAPFNPSAAFDKLEILSALLAAEAATGTAQLSNGALKLTGTKTGLNVFAVDGGALAQAFSVQVSVPTGASVLINVTGSRVAIENKGFTITGATAAAMLWNLPGASFLKISSVGLTGSVLAPRARVTFDSGSINGSLVARAFTSSGSGTLQFTALKMASLFPASTPSAVALAAAQPLVRGCKYTFVIPSTQVLTSAGGCLSTSLSVSFKVAPVVSTPASRELVNLVPETNGLALRRFAARAGINTSVDDVWTRYAGAIGVPAAELVPTGVSRPSSTRAGQTVTTYQQYHLGYPVVGYGYFAAVENGSFRNANGSVIVGLPNSLPTPITESAAIQAALRNFNITQAPWIANPSTLHPPVDRLVLTPLKSRATGADFSLVWDLRLAGTGITNASGIQIDAATGAVVRVDAALKEVALLNILADYNNQQVNDTVDTLYNDHQTINVAQYLNPDGRTTVTTLSTGDVTAAGVLNMVFKPTPTGVGVNVIDPTPATPWTSTEPTERVMASGQWGLEEAASFLNSLGLQFLGNPWPFVDGVGHQQVLVTYEDPTPRGTRIAAYDPSNSTADRAIVKLVNGTVDGTANGAPIPPIEADVLAHEFAHVLLADLRRAAGLGDLIDLKEAGSVEEGLADLYVIAFNRKKFGTDIDWQCLLRNFDGTGLGCLENVADPSLSKLRIAATDRAGQPSFYLDTTNFYQDFSGSPPSSCSGKTNDACGIHLNSTIVSHWAYLLGVGSATTPGNLCGLPIAPLDPDPETGLRMVLNLAHIAAGTRFGPSEQGLSTTPTFADFREATVQVAQDLVAGGTYPPDTVAKVEQAWTAVGLAPPVAVGDPTARPSNTSSVYPWATFSWPSGGTLANDSWTVEITNQPFAAKPAILGQFTSVGAVDAQTGLASLTLALPHASTDTFYWHALPAGNPALPAGCVPTYSFQGTTTPDAIKQVALGEGGVGGVLPGPVTDVQAGPFGVQWDPVKGADSYDVDVAPTGPACAATADAVLARRVAAAGDNNQGTKSATSDEILQPETHYFLGVRPVGPQTFDHLPDLGDCNGIEFDTATLRAPDNGFPFNDTTFDFHSTGDGAGLHWFAQDGAVKSRLRFYPLDVNGNCAAEPSGDPILIDNQQCLSPQCQQSLPSPSFPRGSVGGYCWDVTSIAANGKESEPSSPLKKFVYDYFFDFSPSSPGYFTAPTGQFALAQVLPGDSYGKPVIFSWSPVPDSSAYGIKLGRWPWNGSARPTLDPRNCDGLPVFDYCLQEPAKVTFRTDPVDPVLPVQYIRETSKMLPGQVAGQGRYCWMLWPVLDDPASPGTTAQSQPGVQPPLRCYVSGPAAPKITFDPGAAPPGDVSATGTPPTEVPAYTGKPITGKIHFDFVAFNSGEGYQYVSLLNSDLAFGPACVPDPASAPFQDIYNCDVQFQINHPQKGGSYGIRASVFTPIDDPPVDGHTTKVGEQIVSFNAGTCGHRDDVCCPHDPSRGEAGCDDDSTCHPETNRCGDCGDRDGLCCDGAPRCKGRNICNIDHCVECGSEGNVCCDNPAIVDRCDAGLVCGGDNGCHKCGGNLQNCCLTGTQCFGNNVCIQGECLSCGSGPNDRCCAGNACPAGTVCGNGICKSCGAHGATCCPGPQRQCGDAGDECAGGICQSKTCTQPFTLSQVTINSPFGVNHDTIFEGNFIDPNHDACNFFPFSASFFAFGWQPLCGAVGYEVAVFLDPSTPAINISTSDLSYETLGGIAPPDLNSEIACFTDNWIFTVTGINGSGQRSQPGYGLISVPLH